MPASVSVITALTAAAALVQIARALPISQNHRFAVYPPYWQGQHYAPSSLYSHRQLRCGGEPCADRLNLLPNQPGETNNGPLIKRTKGSYKTGWTMGGMPFSVLYMNPKPKISVRSPVSEPLRSSPPNYDNLEAAALPIPESRVEDEALDLDSETFQNRVLLDHAPPTTLPTRKQYSIIPQLFVSYGWGPLGK